MSLRAADSLRLAVYGEVNANLLDGSSIWLQSICLTLATIPGVRVTLLLRAPLERELVVASLVEHPRIEVVDPARWPGSGLLSPLGALDALGELDEEERFDLVLLRGAAVGSAAAESGRFAGRTWLYHVPVEGEDPAQFARDAVGAHRVLCQTEAIRERVETAVPELASRTMILPPMVPPSEPPPRRGAGPIRRLFYAGKISPEYCALEMVELLGLLRGEIPDLELHIAGDKIHNPPEDPEFRERAREALEGTKGLVWHGGLQRHEVAALMREADVALSLRHSSLDESAEMSTKVLEYGAAGCAVVLNPTETHRSLLGTDYPLLAATVEEAASVLLVAHANPALREEAGRRVEDLSREHSFDRVAALIAPHLRDGREQAPADPAIAGPPTPSEEDGSPRLLIAGHSLGFAESLVERARHAGAALREDRWSAHAVNDEEAGEEALRWADVILCEWCLGNAAWYSHKKRRGQSLVVRFHRMELETPHPLGVEFENVDAMVFVARHVLEAACEKYGWPLDDPRLRVVPNALDLQALRQPKLPGAEFNLGMIGFVPWVKRLDRILDILERLRSRDDRFRLLVKGRGPWEYDWMGVREDERRCYEQAFARLESSPSLRGAVTFEEFGNDVPEFLRQVGWIVSTSEIEGHSVALAEGMASGAIPVVIDRPGARDQYATRWVHADPEGAANAIADLVNRAEVGEECASAREYAERWSWTRIGPEWDRLLHLST